MGKLKAGWSFLTSGFSVLKNVVIGGGGLLAGWGAVGGPNSLPQQLLKNIFTLQETAGKEAGVAGAFQGFYKIAEMLASLLESVGIPADGLDKWAKERLNSVPSGEDKNIGEEISQSVMETTDHTVMGNIAGLAASVPAAAITANALLPAATPILASMGMKAIPGLASLWAAGETIWDTVGYAWDGDWQKAGTRVVAGVGETVAGLGGFLTYGTLGTAWREAVRAGGAAVFGEEHAIRHSTVVEAGSFLYDHFTNGGQPRDERTTAPLYSTPSYVPVATP